MVPNNYNSDRPFYECFTSERDVGMEEEIKLKYQIILEENRKLKEANDTCEGKIIAINEAREGLVEDLEIC